MVVTETGAMIAGMTPSLRLGTFAFVTARRDQEEACSRHAIGMFLEAEGRSFILPIENAQTLGFENLQPMRCITLGVYSSLEGVGLTAAVASALAAEGIACNMVAAFHHDHAFVPEPVVLRAMEVLNELADTARAAM